MRTRHLIASDGALVTPDNVGIRVAEFTSLPTASAANKNWILAKSGLLYYSDGTTVRPIPTLPVDPNADRIVFWDDSASNWAYLTLDTGLSISGTTLSLDSDLSTIGALADPNADRILFWDDSASSYAYLAPSTGLSISGTNISNTGYVPGGTDVSLADGGTGASLVDPNADRMLFWDDSAGAVTFLAPDGTHLAITGTTLDVGTIPSTSITGMAWTFINAASPSSVSSSSMDSLFSSTYDHYLITYRLSMSAANAALNFRFRASGADDSNANYANNHLYQGASIITTNNTGQTSGAVIIADGAGVTNTDIAGVLFIFNPQDADETVWRGEATKRISAPGARTELPGGYFNNTTAFTGFSFLPASGNITGTWRVYGARDS